jgi:hypothetical protein
MSPQRHLGCASITCNSMGWTDDSLQHPAAVLAVCFGSSPSVAFFGGLDKRVRQYVLHLSYCYSDRDIDREEQLGRGGEEHEELIVRWDLESGQCKVLGKHDDAVSSLAWCSQQSTFLSVENSDPDGAASNARRARFRFMGLYP